MFSDTIKPAVSAPLPYLMLSLEHWQLVAGGVAHDFNNLLSSILGQSSLALRHLPEDAAARLHIEKVIKAAEFAANLSNQLLNYSKGNEGAFERINLNALAQDNLSLLDATFLDGISLQMELASELPPVQAKTGQLQQVVMNLLINAAEAIHPEQGVITIRTGAHTFGKNGVYFRANHGRSPAYDDYVYLQIQDDGPGMDQATAAQIFKPYFSTKPAGRGLGLSAVHEIVQAHGGIITINSQEGNGATFTVYLPCGVAAQPPPSADLAK